MQCFGIVYVDTMSVTATLLQDAFDRKDSSAVFDILREIAGDERYSVDVALATMRASELGAVAYDTIRDLTGFYPVEQDLKFPMLNGDIEMVRHILSKMKELTFLNSVSHIRDRSDKVFYAWEYALKDDTAAFWAVTSKAENSVKLELLELIVRHGYDYFNNGVVQRKAIETDRRFARSVLQLGFMSSTASILFAVNKIPLRCGIPLYKKFSEKSCSQLAEAIREETDLSDVLFIVRGVPDAHSASFMRKILCKVNNIVFMCLMQTRCLHDAVDSGLIAEFIRKQKFERVLAVCRAVPWVAKLPAPSDGTVPGEFSLSRDKTVENFFTVFGCSRETEADRKRLLVAIAKLEEPLEKSNEKALMKTSDETAKTVIDALLKSAGCLTEIDSDSDSDSDDEFSYDEAIAGDPWP